MKLRPKVLSLVLGILIIAFLVLSIPLYWYARSAMEDELNKRLLTVCKITGKNLNLNLLQILIREPSLSNVRATMEEDLSMFLVDQIEGMAIYNEAAIPLVEVFNSESDLSRITVLLQSFAASGIKSNGTVSEIYTLSGGNYIKAAAIPVITGLSSPAVLVVWGGAEFMTIVEQITGSLFWIVLISIIVAVSLAIVFSQSLIQPVKQLSAYAKSIQENIYSVPVDLKRDDEFGDLNQSLSDMHMEIKQNEQSTKQLLSGIAHEIKNPLGGIEIYSELLNEELSTGSSGKTSGEQQSYLGKITQELRHLKQIVLEYLDYARPLKSELKSLSIESMFEDAYRILLPEFKQKKVEYTFSGNGEVVGDESKLRRVFVNLLKNGLEAVVEEGSITVDIRNHDSAVGIEVSDDGAGIPEDSLDKIFQPYFTTQDRGYGLGLTIVKNIINEMNGTIIVKSKVGKGTRFILELPTNHNG